MKEIKWIIVFVTLCLMSLISFFAYLGIELGWDFDWGSFTGGIIGGTLTLIGVMWTIKHMHKQSRIQAEISIRPYLFIYPIIEIEQASQGLCPFELKMRNDGTGAARIESGSFRKIGKKWYTINVNEDAQESGFNNYSLASNETIDGFMNSAGVVFLDECYEIKIKYLSVRGQRYENYIRFEVAGSQLNILERTDTRCK